MELKGNQAFSLKNVTIHDPYLRNAYEKEVQYLLSFETNRLLAGFRETAGVSMHGAQRYPGWESMLIGGHTLGHYMTACVKACESANCSEENRRKFIKILCDLTDGLWECQENMQSGFLFGAKIIDIVRPEKQFDMVERNQSNIMTQAWVPWYTMHKIIEGLVSVCGMKEQEKLSKKALCVLSRLADWVYERVSSWDEETHRIVLGIEYGGMNDCMYDTYLLTAKEEHLLAAKAFDETELFRKIGNARVGEHVLNNHHANTTIPKFMGALKRYVVTGEKEFYFYAVKFWELVTGHHTYITGGNSEWEHFGEDDVLDAERTNCNCETCNAYNMLKMTKLLFMISGEGRFADWYEKTFVNSVLSSQNPKTGMTTYFQPMAGGYHKVYGEPFTKFWCCTGTGMENFTKLQESFYFNKGDSLIVNQYFSSSVTFQGTEFVAEADLLQSEMVKIKIKDNFTGRIYLRLPGWIAGDAEIKINGAEYSYNKTEDDAYAVLQGPFAAETLVELKLPMQLRAHGLPDNRNVYAFTYGPVVLSALLGNKMIQEGITGVDVTISQNRLFEACYLPSGEDLIRIKEGDVKTFMENINKWLVRTEAGTEFELKGTDASLVFVPHFSQHSQRYGIYFYFVGAAEKAEYVISYI